MKRRRGFDEEGFVAFDFGDSLANSAHSGADATIISDLKAA